MIQKVKKRTGEIVDFDGNKIERAIIKAMESVDKVDNNLSRKLTSNIIDELNKLFDNKIPDIESIQNIIEKELMKENLLDVAKSFILYREKHKDIRKKKEEILSGKKDNIKLSINSLKVLERRYLLKDKDGKVIETPTQLFKRVAKNIAKADLFYDKNANLEVTENDFFNVMYNLEFLPNSPTLMNAGTSIQQLSACFVLPIDDSIEDIFQAIKYTALIHKSGGGTGFSFSRLRPKNSIVKTTKGVSSGPVSFMSAFNACTEVIKQGGKRRGANMAILRVDHPDILDFITCKEEEGKLNNFNISVGITDEFMKAVERGTYYNLVDPHTKKIVSSIDARQVFDLIVIMAWRNGEPGIIFLDKINEKNPTPNVGEIESTNPCGEQPLLPYESCNLGSINVDKFAKKDKNNNYFLDWDRLRKVVHIAVHFLDNVIDMNKFPIKEIEEMTKANRKIGLGIMGFADLLFKLKIPYNSKEGIDFAEKLMKFIRDEGRKASMKLAELRGVFKNYKLSVLQKENRPQRNATITTIAPTGTISMIANASSGCEPLFALAYTKHVMDDDDLYYGHSFFEKVLKERGIYSPEIIKKISEEGTIKNIEEIPDDIKKIFVTAHDISPEWHIKMQSAFQKYVESAVSKTVNFANSATPEDVRTAYKLAYKLNCKGVTIYRDKSRNSQVLNLKSKDGNVLNTKNLTKIYLDSVRSTIKTQAYIDDFSKDSNLNLNQDKTICPICKTKLEFKEGCASCPNCGFSFCNG